MLRSPQNWQRSAGDCIKQLIPREALIYLIVKAPESRPSTCSIRTQCANAQYILITTASTFCESDLPNSKDQFYDNRGQLAALLNGPRTQ